MPNGHAWTEGDEDLFTDLREYDQTQAIAWCSQFIQPRKTENRNYTSYGLKHLLEAQTKIYMTNNQFKDLMLCLGHKPVHQRYLNWTFRIRIDKDARL